jgi:hypothetical protein
MGPLDGATLERFGTLLNTQRHGGARAEKNVI